MKITILTVGNRGDIQPYIALGLGLKQAGHDVQIATQVHFRSMINEYLLDFYPIAGDFQQLLSTEMGHNVFQSGGNFLNLIYVFREMIASFIKNVLSDFCYACQGTEAIIASYTAPWGYDIAEKLDVPFYFAPLIPATANRDFPAPNMPDIPILGGIYNQLSYPIMLQLFWQLYQQYVNHWRESMLNLPSLLPWRQPLGRMDKQGIPFLYGYSANVLPKPSNWTDKHHVTGYWFLDTPENFIPPPELVNFLAAGKPPVYIGFGNMIGRYPEMITEIILAALAKTEQRGIFLTDWDGISNSNLPDHVFKLESIPHHWLFPQMSAIIHHGGAGTTAAAFRAGIPAIAIPFFADQPFWGNRITQLGVGPEPIPKKQLTVELLSAAIQRVVTDENMRSRATILGEKIRAEDGVKEAVNIFHQYFYN